MFQVIHFQIVRQQCRERLRGLGAGQVLEEMVEIGPGLQAVGLRVFDQAVEQCTGLRAPRAAGEEPVFAADYKGPDRVLGDVVVQFQATVVEDCLLYTSRCV